MEYTPPVGGDPGDPYIDANPGGGIDGSPVPAQAIEDVMREMDDTITQGGLTPSAGDLTQLAAAIRGLVGRNYVLINDEKAQNTHGGTFTSGAWRTRDLNQEKSDLGGLASLSSNQITLDAGTYLCRIACPGDDVDLHQGRLYNVTDTAQIIAGTAENTTSGTPVTQTKSLIVGVFTIAASKALEVQHRCGITKASTGFGQAANFTTEVYTVAEFWRIA